MESHIAALEISNRYYELVIGYVLDGKVDILYHTKRQLSVPFKDGDVYDIGSLSDDLSKIKNIEVNSANHKLNITVNEVVLVLPSYGLEVYRVNKTTNTVSNTSKIDKIDISNAIGLVKKEKLPNANDVIADIVPNYFFLDDDKGYPNPPLGITSQSITIDANVYTLPGKMISNLKAACENAGLRIKREIISPLGISGLLANNAFKYSTYMLVDFSNKTTTLSFIGNNKLYASNFFSIGIDDLIDRYIADFQITREKAVEIKNIYGLDYRKTFYNPPIIENTLSDGLKKTYNKDDISNSTLVFLKNWISFFNGSFKTILKDYPKYVNEIPLIFIGEGSDLNGLKDYMLKMYNSNPLEILDIPTVGCRNGEYCGCLGAIYLSSTYRGAMEDDNKNRVGELNRIREPGEQSDKTKEKYSELRDEL